MQERFRAHLLSLGLIGGDASTSPLILVGYSGGADSTCLLHLLHSVGANVVAAHLHHGQRKEADDEAEKCAEFCDSIGIPLVTGKADVPTLSRDLKIGLEEAGREARYRFFRQAALQVQADWIATAHTRDDHTETILLHLVRGTGLTGLGGIPEVRDGIVRPLLPFSREETRTYCQEHRFWFHDDPANQDEQFARSRIRLRVMPELRAINPNVEASLLRFSQVVREEDDYLNGLAARALEGAEMPLNGELAFLTRDCEAAFDAAALTRWGNAIARRAVRLLAAHFGGELDFTLTDAVVQALAEPKASFTLPEETLDLVVDGGILHAARRDVGEPFRFPLTWPGDTDSDVFGWSLSATPSEGTTTVRASTQAAIDLSLVKTPLYFRSAEPGDKMQPLGFEGHRKLADLLSEAKLTRAARRRLPIICDMIGPIWAPGVCLSQRVAAGPASERVLIVRFGPLARS